MEKEIKQIEGETKSKMPSVLLLVDLDFLLI